MMNRPLKFDQEIAAIIDAISAPVVRYRADGALDFTNQTWRDYTGLTGDDLIRHRWGAVHPDDRLMAAEAWRAHVAAGAPFSSELRLQRKDGEYRWHRIDISPLRDGGGQITNWYGVGHDIEDRKCLDRQTRTAEQELRSIIDSIPSLVWQADPKGVVEYYNQRGRDFAGLTSSGKWDWELMVHPDDAVAVSKEWAEKLAQSEPFEIEARIKRFDGQYRWFLFRAEPTIDASGRVLRWYGVNTDIENLKRAEDASRESEQLFRDFSESASDWFWESGPDHCFTQMAAGRPEFKTILHKPPIGQRRWDNAADFDEEPAKWRDHIASLDAHLPFRGFTYRVRLKDGSMMYMGVSGIPRFDAHGQFMGYRGSATDVTAIVRARQSEDALRKAQIELAHVTRVTTLGELSASIAHEINQPLAGVSGNGAACMRWLNRDPPQLAEVRASVQAMMSECTRAGNIISRIRSLAQKGPPEMAPLDLNDVVRESALLVQHTMQKHRVALQLDLSESPLEISGDRVQLQQVVINLIMNGIESMESITDRSRQIALRSESDNGKAIVEVRDSGAGIDPANINQLFDAFFTTKQGGLGMGLSISRSLIEAHKGRLTAETDDEIGAVFRIQIPVAPNQQIESADQK
jgi:PAS domain S-box-containing protein